MPRKLRIEYLGAMYHVRVAPWRPAGEDFLDDVDPQDFIKMLADASQKTNWQAQAYCLVPTHCHLALETPEANLVAGMAAPEHGPSWVRVDRLLGEHGIQEDTPASRAQFEPWMDRRRLEAADPEALKVLRRGWCLGSQSFRRELLLRLLSVVSELPDLG